MYAYSWKIYTCSIKLRLVVVVCLRPEDLHPVPSSALSGGASLINSAVAAARTGRGADAAERVVLVLEAAPLSPAAAGTLGCF